MNHLPLAEERTRESKVSFAVRDVAISRGGRRIVERISLSLRAGDALILRGPNGAGKTTLLRALAGLLPIDAGTVAATDGDGQPCEAPALSIYCGPLNAVKSAMTVRENLQFWSALYSAPRPRLEEALDAFSLRKYADRPAGALSTGLARRLGLSRLVIADRPLWLVDEPTASLDASSITAFVALAERRRRTGGVVIAATHDAMTLESAQSMELITERAHA